MNTLNAAFRDYWTEWAAERPREEFWDTEFQRVMLESELQIDPLFSTGLLTNAGLQCYRSVVPLDEHNDQSLLKGEKHATNSVPSDARSDQQLADHDHANAG